MKSSVIRLAYAMMLGIAVVYAFYAMRGPHGVAAWNDKRQQIRELEERNATLIRENLLKRKYIDRLRESQAEQELGGTFRRTRSVYGVERPCGRMSVQCWLIWFRHASRASWVWATGPNRLARRQKPTTGSTDPRRSLGRGRCRRCLQKGWSWLALQFGVPFMDSSSGECQKKDLSRYCGSVN